MPHFVMLIRYTQQGIAKIEKARYYSMLRKRLPRRLAASFTLGI